MNCPEKTKSKTQLPVAWQTPPAHPGLPVLRHADGQFAYPTKASLLDYLMAHMPNPDNAPAAVCRAQFGTYLSQLKHWKEEE